MTGELYALARSVSCLPSMVFQYRMNPDGTCRYDYVNQAIEAIFGLTPGQVLDDPMTVMERMHPDDASQVRRYYGHSAATQTALRYQYRVHHPEQGLLWVEEYAQPESLPDGSILWHGQVVDITEFKVLGSELSLSRARLREASELAQLGHWEVDLRNDDVWWCDATFEMLGHDTSDFKPTAEEYWGRVHPDDLERVKANHESALQARRPEIKQIEYRIRRSDGEFIWVNHRARIRFDEFGEPVQIFGTTQDISERKRLEQTLIDSKMAADRANQFKSDFVLGMSHELRTPLNAVLGFGQLLQHDPDLTPEQAANLEEIQRAGQHLLGLIDEILDLSKVESGRLELSTSTEDCGMLAEEAISLVTALAENRCVRLELDVEDDIAVDCDPTRLRQVMVNLLSNGIKYNRPNGEVKLSVRRQGDGDQEGIRIDVKDTGIGIPQDRIADVFRPFERLGREHVEGTGIGLVISKRLVEAMGGSLSVESVQGSGSRFSITMPLGDGAQSSVRATRSVTVNAEKARGLVLHIDDSMTNLRLLQRVLSPLDAVDYMGSPTGSLGLDLATAYKPRLIFLDLELPDMHGFEVLGRLRSMAATRHIPVVGLTARASAKDVCDGLEAGFNRYIGLPFDIDEVMGAIHAYMAQDEPG
ncbi:MAG: PAS domain S-box protein [Chromatiaceae bacterium]|nr:MAG: PAS domain S-box protein [Chromatiaceae bacterium]